ncbi:MAG: LysR family transcriptional regulator [Aeromicrobium sp.]
MNLRTLRYFVATVDEGSVSAASELVHVSQPSLSRQLRQLEKSLSVELFVRGGGKLSLSAAGRQFLPIARDLLVRADSAQLAAETIAAGRLERLTIAAPTTTLTDVIAPFLATLGPDDPIPTVFESEPSQDQSRLILGADLAIMTEPPRRPLASLALAVLPIWAYVPAGHRWASKEQITLAELAEETLILMAPQFKPRVIVSRALDDFQVSVGEVLECSNAQVAQALAAAGRGVAVVSDDPRFGLHPLRIMTKRGQLSIRLYAAWDSTHHAVDTLSELSERLRAFCADRYGVDVEPGRRRE